MIYVALIAAGVGTACGALILLAAQRAAVAIQLARERKKRPEFHTATYRLLVQKQEAIDGLPPWLREWLQTTSKRLQRAGVEIPVVRYLLGVLLAAVAGFTVGITLLNNFPAAVVLSMAAFLVPDAIVSGRTQAQRNKVIDQLGAAVRLFAAEFNDTPQVARALARTAQDTPPPLGNILRRASRDLAAGKDKDEVLAYLMRELDTEYGRMFVQLLRIAWEDAAVKSLFSRLAVRIGSLQSLIQKNRSETAYGRWMGIFVNMMVLPMFLVVRRLVPDAASFLTGHPVGRTLVFLSFLSVLVGLVVDRLLSSVDA